MRPHWLSTGWIAPPIASRFASTLRQLAEQADQASAELEAKREFVETLARDRFAGSELLAKAWEDYEIARAEIEARDLVTKSHPAYVSADVVRAKGWELAAVHREAKYLGQVLRLYEWHVPWLAELRDYEAEEGYVELVKATGEEEPTDPVAGWLTREEYDALSTVERNQRALDRYRRANKSPWKIGRDYERYIGYLHEQDGFQVEYHGIAEGLADLGRDVIARKGESVRVIQCKRWARHKTIHEKHVFQLFGTVFAYRIEHPGLEVGGRFVTSTSLSPVALEYARRLEIEVVENFGFDDAYPCIKCNISMRNNDLIYHLPFDQAYDATIVHPERGEFYCATVAEAEGKGLRRAFRWRPAEADG